MRELIDQLGPFVVWLGGMTLIICNRRAALVIVRAAFDFSAVLQGGLPAPRPRRTDGRAQTKTLLSPAGPVAVQERGIRDTEGAAWPFDLPSPPEPEEGTEWP